MEVSTNRHLPWDACYNVRDIGGYPTENGKQIRWGAFIRADCLYRLTEDGQQNLVDYGVRTIIDLRNTAEITPEPNPFSNHHRFNGHLKYYNMPIIDDDNLSVNKELRLARTMRETYLVMLDRFADRFARVLRIMVRAEEGSVLFHCYAGKDRTGLTAMLLLGLAGVPDDVITADYTLTDRYLVPLYDKLMAAGPDDPVEREKLSHALHAEEGYIRGALANVHEKYGGVEPYLIHAGLSESEISILRGRLIAQ